ncbi:hypothetical protein [Streptomyces sp. SPB162]|uniref:DinB/UmuC family translesion DNA polymerase n=1 Tax=Streptomyces sp. SPB162 TaxID=2940560 RepID=UPI002404FBA6|nr:hypothetical protein [Streptomyces sp. SPB162]MDF9811790.1 hypothetical protein [Streptomyces sp. SPB162]
MLSYLAAALPSHTGAGARLLAVQCALRMDSQGRVRLPIGVLRSLRLGRDPLPWSELEQARWLRRTTTTPGSADRMVVAQILDEMLGDFLNCSAWLGRWRGGAHFVRCPPRPSTLDPRPVVPSEPAARLVADLVLERDCLDPLQHHRTVVGLADRIGQRLRGESRIAGGFTPTVRYADRSSTARTRILPEPANHSPTLVSAALG